ncbi:MAG: NapD protein [Verrucomicrobiota bacterium]|jgi:nitrate reductase NapAB chaperone NapD
MPVCSFIIHPAPGATEELVSELSAFPGCEATPSDDLSLLVLVSETDTREEMEELTEKLRCYPRVLSLSITFGQL